MVESHRPQRPQAIVVKRGHQRRVLLQHRLHCVVCGMELSHGHGPGELYCYCHPTGRYKPAIDRDVDRHVLDYLAAAWPHPLRLLRALGVAPEDQHGRHLVERSVRRWRERGVPIVTVRGLGYRLGYRK